MLTAGSANNLFFKVGNDDKEDKTPPCRRRSTPTGLNI